jgi:hypothetical protein
MTHTYVRKENGEQVTVVSVELLGPAAGSEWIVTLSNSEQLFMHEFIEQFDAAPEVSRESRTDSRRDGL